MRSSYDDFLPLHVVGGWLAGWLAGLMVATNAASELPLPRRPLVLLPILLLLLLLLVLLKHPLTGEMRPLQQWQPQVELTAFVYARLRIRKAM